MSDPADARLQRLLGGETLAPLRRRLRQRFERAPADRTIAQIRVDGLAADEHAALATLIGRRQRHTGSLTMDLGVVDGALRRAGIAASLRDALERLDGPIAHPATLRLQQEALWGGVGGACSHPDLIRWLGTSDGIGLLKRLAGQDAAAATELCRSVEAVLRQLPAKGIARSQLAANVLGDAHALDNGQAVATLVLAVRRRLGPAMREDEDSPIDPIPDGQPQQPGAAERARDVWARAGVLVNQLARPALFLNLPIADRAWVSGGEPAYLSLRSLLRSPPPWDVAGQAVFVCENPNLLAIAADRWGEDCAPMVCTDGMPAAAQRCLLLQLTQAQARLCYHGDFDWPGLRIGNLVMREFGATSWRFDAAHYVAAVSTARGPTQCLEGTAIEASWDESLAAAMREQGVAIAEEAVATTLLPDLRLTGR